MKRMKNAKTISLLMVLLLVLQLVPLGTALATQDGDAPADAEGLVTVLPEDEGDEEANLGDSTIADTELPANAEELDGVVTPFAVGIGTGTVTDLTGTDYLIIHPTTGANPTAIEIKNKDGEKLTPTDGVYNGVPAGSTIELKLGFTLSEGDGIDNIYDYDGTEFFTFQLPQGITFNPINNIAIEDGNGTQIATGTITGNTLTVQFNENIKDQSGIWGHIIINGTFDSIASGAPGETSFKLGEETVTIKRGEDPKPPAGKINLDKNGSYDPSTNKITWEVIVTPSSETQTLAGYKLTDTYSDNQTYVSGTFKVDTEPTLMGTLTEGTNSLTYIFPDTAQGTQVITYETEITSGNTYEPATPFKNTAKLYEPGKDTVLKEAEKTISPGSVIKKEGGTVQPDKQGQIDWIVTVTLPEASNGGAYYLPNAKIIDEMDSRLELIDSVTYSYDGSDYTPVSKNEAGGVAGQYSVSGNTLTFLFPANEPHTGKTAVLKYSTRVKDWDNVANNNSSLTFTNNARFEWETNPDGTGSGGSSVSFGTGEVKKTTATGGYISKAVVGASQSQYAGSASNYIKWRVTVNANRVSLTNPSIQDAIQPGHQLVIDDDGHNFIVKKNGTALATFTTSSPPQTDAGTTLTIIDSTHFTLTFPAVTTTDSYTVEYYTELTEEGISSLYAGASSDTTQAKAEFKNDVDLYLGVQKSGSDSATKTYTLEMLNKSHGTYSVAEHAVQWTLVVNRNELPMTDAKVSDLLGDGMELWIEEGKSFKVVEKGNPTPIADITSTTPLDGSLTLTTRADDTISGFTYALPSSTSKQYTITYWTKVTDDALRKIGVEPGESEAAFWDANKQHEFENTATLVTGKSSNITAESKVTAKNPMISKVKYDDSVTTDEVISWRAVINPSQITLANGVVTDTLSNNLQLIDKVSPTLVDTSIRLYEIEVNANGDWKTTGAKIPVSVTKVDTFETDRPVYTYDAANRILTVYLPANTPRAYLLEFDTALIDNTTTGPFTNTISLSDGTTSDTGTSNSVTVNQATAIGGMYSNKITVTKTDDNADESERIPLIGAEFQLYNASGNAVKRSGNNVIATDKGDGTYEFTNLPAWVFQIKEIKPPAGYLITNSDFITVNGGSKIGANETVTVTNKLGLETVEIKKLGAENKELTGGSFALYKVGDDTNIFNGPVSAATGGKVTFTNVPFGSYYIKELIAPNGHEAPDPEKPEDYKVYVNVGYKLGTNYRESQVTYSYSSGGSSVANPKLINIPKTTGNQNPDVQFVKVSQSAHATKPLQGVGFILKDMSGNEVETATSGADGVVKFTSIPYGEYEIYEEFPDAGYLWPSDKSAPIYKIKISYADDSHTTLKVEFFTPADLATALTNPTYVNVPAVADVSFDKKSTASDTIKINGGSFKISGESEAGPYEATATAKDGEVKFESVPVNADGQSYTIEELISPPGYQITKDKLTVEVTYESSEKLAVATPIFKDGLNILKNEPAPYTPAPVNLSVLKTDEDGVKLSGAVFTLYDRSGKAIAAAVSDATGIAVFAGIPADESYTIRETAAPLGYALSEETIHVSTFAGTTHSFTMVNKKLDVDRGSIVITKTDETGVLLSGATFTLYDEAGTAVATAVSDASGSVRFTDIPVGSYTIRETAAPEGFILSTEVLSVPLEKDATRSFTFVNRRSETPGSSTGSIGLLKVNSDGQRLAGAEFSLYDANGSLVGRAVTNADGIVRFTSLPFGTYSVRETVAPTGYKLFEGAQTVEITAANPDRSFTLRNTRDDEPEIGGWEEIPDDEVPGGGKPGEPGSKLPQTGGVPQSLFLLLAGLALLGVGVSILKGQRKQDAAASGTDE